MLNQYNAEPCSGWTEIPGWGNTVWPPASTEVIKIIKVTNLGPPKNTASEEYDPGTKVVYDR